MQIITILLILSKKSTFLIFLKLSNDAQTLFCIGVEKYLVIYIKNDKNIFYRPLNNTFLSVMDDKKND